MLIGCQIVLALSLAQASPSLSLRFDIAQHSDRRAVDLSVRAPLERTLSGGAVATALGHLRSQIHTPNPLLDVGQPLLRRLPQPHQALQATRQTF